MRSIPLVLFTRKAAFLALTVVMLALASPLLAASITLPDGSAFEVELVAHGGGSYTYQVSEVSGKDLSHWLLEFGICAEHLVSAEPTGYELGLDASTGYTGIKWNVTDEFTSGLFTITLDAEYPLGQVQALVKAGSQHAVGYVDGPVCNVQPPPQDPEPPTATQAPQDDPTPEPPTATQTPGDTIPPVPTATPGGPTATQTAQPSDDPAPTATQPGATETPAPPTATTQPDDPTPTLTPPVIITIVPPTATPTLPPPTVEPPTPTPTGPPTNEDDGPEPKFWYYWLPLVSDCRYGDSEFQGCGR